MPNFFNSHSTIETHAKNKAILKKKEKEHRLHFNYSVESSF